MTTTDAMKMTCPVTNAERQQSGWGAILCHPVQDMISSYIHTAITSPSLPHS